MSGYVATDVFGRRTSCPTIRKHLSAASSEHNTHILRSGMPGLPASDLYSFRLIIAILISVEHLRDRGTFIQDQGVVSVL